ncbi:MAG: plastocyanin/azurin family copper-binding protein [Verrucomicrobia bacterium]|nr:plastocyanin/azurin family copper-binding protein [Verrucomicrobiota bacterium]
MKLKKYIHLGGAAILLFAFGCSRKTEYNAMADTVSLITITSNDAMRFSPNRFYVKAGDTITLTLHNIGSMPKETMGHNLVILQRGVAINAFAAASLGHPDKHYVAPEFAHRVVAWTEVIGPGEKVTVTFLAPIEPGEYEFVCSFPGHTPVGMKGRMVVVP